MGITKLYIGSKKLIDEMNDYKYVVHPNCRADFSVDDHAADAFRYFFISTYQQPKRLRVHWVELVAWFMVGVILGLILCNLLFI